MRADTAVANTMRYLGVCTLALSLVAAPAVFGGVRSYVAILQSPLAIALGAVAVIAALRLESRRHLRRLESELARHSKEIKKLQEDAKRTAEFSDRILANISHEIRTPMNGILGMTELTLAENLTTEHRANLQLVRSSSHALLTIINDILDLSKAQAGKMKLKSVSFSLRTQVSETMELLRERAEERGLALDAEVAGHLPDSYVGDPYRLCQVMLNILGNALKFTNSGGVHLSVEGGANGEDVELQFSIRDTGIGLTPERQADIFKDFDLFEGLRNRRNDGAGLGLAISKQLVTAMGGRIWVESEPGRGSTFHFTIRLQLTNSPPDSERARLTMNSERRRPLRVLVAEDNPMNQKVIASILHKRGHYMTVAMDGVSAVSMYDRGDFDVVLMDVHMPGMDGLEATKAIREKEVQRGGPRIRIIALTADALEGDKERCIQAGMDGYMAKPIDVDQLLTTLEK